MLLVPRARARVKPWLALRVEPAQLGAQHLSEQRVVAIRRAAAVQAHEQHVRASELPERPGGAALAAHRVAERPGQGAENRRAEEKGQLIRLELRQQLVPQVVSHHLVVTGEAGERTVHVALSLQGERCEVEARGPALGLAHQGVEPIAPDACPGRPEQRARLRASHGHVGRSQLENPAVGSQAAQGQLRFGSRRQRKLGTGRHRARELVEGAKRLRRTHEVRVVDHEHRRRLAVVHSSPDSGEQPIGVVVAGAQVDPRESTPIARGPFREQCRFPVARWRHEQHERCVTCLRQPANEPRPRCQPARPCGRAAASRVATPEAVGGGQDGG